MQGEEVPKEQWAIAITGKGKLQVKKIPVPVPASGEVLVKVLAAPINPSDLYMMKGMYDNFDLFKIPYPNNPGWEGAGVVVAVGGGIMTWNCMGRRVSFVRKLVNNNEMLLGGAYQQYCITDAVTLNMINDSLPIEIASMSFVNPITALGLHDKIKQLKAQAAIQTGAASQLGRMLIKLCHNDRIPLINIVRRDEQVKMLKEDYKCEYVLNSSSPNFFEEFTKLAKELKATAMIDAVSGDLTGKLMECLPSRSTVVFYGALSEKGVSSIDPLLFIGRSYRLEGFVLGQYIVSKGLGIIGVIKQMNALIADKTLQSNIQKKFGLANFEGSIADYYKNMTAGKFILCPFEDLEMLKGKEFNEFNLDHLGTE